MTITTVEPPKRAVKTQSRAEESRQDKEQLKNIKHSYAGPRMRP